MKLSTRNQAKGLFRQVRGTLKKFVATVSSNTMLGMKGSVDRFAGKAQWRFGKVQGMVGL